VTTIEKMARAYHERDSLAPWDSLTAGDQLVLIRAMRAALAVLLEPSEGMVDAGNDALCGDINCVCNEEAMFRAMIQAALNEQEIEQ